MDYFYWKERSKALIEYGADIYAETKVNYCSLHIL